MIKRVMFTVMIGFLTVAYSQDYSTDSTAVQEKGRIAAFTNSVYGYGKYSISSLVKAKNAIVSAYKKDTDTRWNAEVDAVYMNLRWDAHMADKWTYQYTKIEKEPFKKIPGYFGVDYGATYEPVVVSLPTKVRTVVNMSYEGSRWSAGIRGWSFNELVQRGGTVRSIGWIVEGDTTYFSITGMREHGASVFPLRNVLDPSGFSPVNWWVGNGLRLTTAEVYTSYKANDVFDFVIALKAIEVENKQILGQAHWAYVPYLGYWWDNHVTLDQRASVTYRALGPMVGFNFHTGPLEVRYQTGTLSSNNVQYDGHWDDVDDIDYWKSDETTLYYDILYNGDFPYDRATRADIESQELQIKLNTPDLDPLKATTATLNGLAWTSSWFPWLENQFSRAAQANTQLENKVYMQFSLGWYQSIFKDAPIAPRWTVPGDWTLAEGTHWALPTRNLVFQGVSVGVTLKF